MDTDNRQENSSDLAGMVVPPVGRLVATADEWEPYRLLDPAGAVVEGVAAFLRELQAAGRSPATLRSYGLDLLRWLRFLWAAGVAWDRATRLEARDFCRWLLVAGKPARSHWRKQGVITTTVRATAGEPYAASVRAHSETVLRGFYDFHRDAGTGPILNPFPLDRSRRGRRAHAHHNPMDDWNAERVGRYRPTVPRRIPRAIPDDRFNELFAALSSNRDRAFVAFWVSTGARASELLGLRQRDVDPGQQLITSRSAWHVCAWPWRCSTRLAAPSCPPPAGSGARPAARPRRRRGATPSTPSERSSRSFAAKIASSSNG